MSTLFTISISCFVAFQVFLFSFSLDTPYYKTNLHSCWSIAVRRNNYSKKKGLEHWNSNFCKNNQVRVSVSDFALLIKTCFFLILAWPLFFILCVCFFVYSYLSLKVHGHLRRNGLYLSYDWLSFTDSRPCSCKGCYPFCFYLGFFSGCVSGLCLFLDRE